MSTEKGWIGVDLDATLAHYDGWKGIAHIGEPIEAMVERIKKMLIEGHDVRIFTARACPQQIGREDAIRHIEDWCEKHIGRRLPVTAIKDIFMLQMIDDRAVAVVPNTGRIIPLDALDRIAELEAERDNLKAVLELHCNDL